MQSKFLIVAPASSKFVETINFGVVVSGISFPSASFNGYSLSKYVRFYVCSAISIDAKGNAICSNGGGLFWITLRTFYIYILAEQNISVCL